MIGILVINYMTDKLNTRTSTLQPELNRQFARALRLMEHTFFNLFITGRAGETANPPCSSTSSATLQKKWPYWHPTGVAAPLNVRGQTIHSFFGFKPGVTPRKPAELRSARRR